MGWIFVLLGILVGWTAAICLMLAGWFLHRRKHYTFCMVMASLASLFNPFGTILDVFTLIVLVRPSVKRLFETAGQPDESDAAEYSDGHIGRGSYNIRGES